MPVVTLLGHMQGDQ